MQPRNTNTRHHMHSRRLCSLVPSDSASRSPLAANQPRQHIAGASPAGLFANQQLPVSCARPMRRPEKSTPTGAMFYCSSAAWPSIKALQKTARAGGSSLGQVLRQQMDKMSRLSATFIAVNLATYSVEGQAEMADSFRFRQDAGSPSRPV